MKRYEQLAASIESMVEGGTLAAGDRIPSVRQASRQHGVSVTTVTSAYRLLETRGVVEARPQSGYYVRERCCHQLGRLEVSRPSRHVRVPRTWDIARQLAEAARDRELVPLGNADPPAELLPAAGLQRRLKGLGPVAERALSYGQPRGELELRTQIARRLAGVGCSLRPDDLLITNGAFEAINLALRATCAPGDAVAVESPVHFILLRILEGLGLRVVEVPTCPEDGIELDALREVLDAGRVKAVLVCPAFSNPVGAAMPTGRVRELVVMCAARSIPLIEDDVYGELHYGPERPVPAKTFDTKGWVLHCSSFSKTIAPGYRVGWLTPGRFEDAILRAKYTTNFVTATPMQLALSAFLRDGAFDRHVRRAARTYADNLARCRDAVARSFPPGTTTSEPRGGLVLWVGLPGDACSLDLYLRALDAGISVVPGHLFSAQGRFDAFVRLAYGHPWTDAFSEAVATVGRLARELVEAEPAA